MIEGTILLILLLGIVVLNPIGDAIRDNGGKRKQKTIELVRDLLFFLMIAFVSGQFTFIVCSGISYSLFRTSIHNVAYNLTRKPKLPWWYAGTTALSDDFEIKYLEGRKTLTLILRVITFAFAVYIFHWGVKSL